MGRHAGPDSIGVGVFDSGVGGLSVYREIKRLLPDQKVIYLADQKNAPYGTKKRNEIRKLTCRAIEFLTEKGCDPVVIACNTATTGGIDFYRGKFPVNSFVGVVPPIKPAAKISKAKKILVLSTPYTSKGVYLKRLIKEFAPKCKVISIGCPEFVELVESGGVRGKQAKQIVKKYLERPLKLGVDTIVLGCTHFPFLATALKKIDGKGVKILEPSFPVARQVLNLNQNSNKKHTLKRGKFVVSRDEFYTSGNANNASRVASKLLKRKIIFRDAR